MYLSYGTILSLLNLFLFVSGSELDYDGWLQIRLWHSFDDEPVPHYIERGNITISSIRSGAAIVAQPSINQLNLEKLVNLAKHNNRYRLKAIVRTSSGSETTFLTSVLACNLLGSSLEDTLYVWLDNTAEPVAVNLVSRGTCSLEKPMTQMWTTEVQVKYPDGGPIPDTATYIQKLEREKQARESGEVKDNRSFFAKYWIYIVPALIFFVLSSASNPEAGGGAGGGGGGGGGGRGGNQGGGFGGGGRGGGQGGGGGGYRDNKFASSNFGQNYDQPKVEISGFGLTNFSFGNQVGGPSFSNPIGGPSYSNKSGGYQSSSNYGGSSSGYSNKNNDYGNQGGYDRKSGGGDYKGGQDRGSGGRGGRGGRVQGGWNQGRDFDNDNRGGGYNNRNQGQGGGRRY